MRKIILIALSCILSLCSYSQSNNIPVQIILLNKDTLQGEVKVKVNAFMKELVYASSFNSRVKFQYPNGEKRKIDSAEILELSLTDLKGKNRKFVKIDDYNTRILEVVYLNKVRWYKDYSFDLYNNSESMYNILFDEKGKQYRIGDLNSYRKKLREFVNDDPIIKEFIKHNEMNDSNILEVLKMYEKTI